MAWFNSGPTSWTSLPEQERRKRMKSSNRGNAELGSLDERLKDQKEPALDAESIETPPFPTYRTDTRVDGGPLQSILSEEREQLRRHNERDSR